MIKRLITVLMILALLLTGCANEIVELYDENPPQLAQEVAEYYDSLGITEDVRKNAEAVYDTYMINENKEVMLRLPEYWGKLFVIQENTGIDVYEKSNYDISDGTMGYLWRIFVNTHEEFEWYIESEFYDNPYVEILGANSAVIGTDDEYVYILSLPTDVQFDFNEEHAWEYYKAAMDNKDKFIADFLEVNNITVNEKAQNLN